jgi:hypothetical protein
MKDIFAPITISQEEWDKAHAAVITAYQSAEDHMKIGPITVDSVHNAAEAILSSWRKARLPIFASTVTRAHSIALEEAIRRLDPQAVIHREPDSETKSFPGPRSVDVEKLLNGCTDALPRLVFYDATSDLYFV